MNKAFLAMLIGLGLMAGLELAWAQTDEVPVPKPPYIAPVPDYGHWIVTFKYGKASNNSSGAGNNPSPAAAPAPLSVPAATNAPPAPSASDGSPTSIETIKTGDLRGITLTFSDGTSKEFTCQGDWVLCSTREGPQLRIASPTALPYIYYTTGFIFLDGVNINPTSFKEAAKHNGVMAFHYHSGGVDVWINPDTMLPLGAKQEGVEVSYQFLTPPPRPFPIPKDQESLLQKEQAAYKATSSMR